MSAMVILDLEWDSAYCVKHHRFVNQIIQIGAVKLNENLEVLDTFEATVRSSVSKKLTGRFVQLTGITVEQMQQGISLADAFLRYNRWVGKDVLTMTWSTSDLYTMLENSRYLLPKGLMLRTGRYMDLQSYVQNEMRADGIEIASQISLSHAAELAGIDYGSMDLHTAVDDCRLSALLLRRYYRPDAIAGYVKDTDNPDFFERLTFKSYTLTNIKDDLIKSADLQFSCERCGSLAKCVTGWKYRNGWFSANFRCSACKKGFIGRVSFKKTYDDLIVRRKKVDLKAVDKPHDSGPKLPAMSAPVSSKTNRQ